MDDNLMRGVKIVVDNWMKIRPGESLLIITDNQHLEEMQQVEKYVLERGAKVLVRIVPEDNTKNSSSSAEELAVEMHKHDVIFGATHISLVTTEIVKRAVHDGSRFLSLPMATNNGRSLLEHDFLTMDTAIARFIAKLLLKYINTSSHIHVETQRGTNFSFRKVGRRASYFNGRAKDNKGFASSSFEVYIPIEENQTFGTGIVDGSLGYLGKVNHPFAIRIEGGKLVEIEQNDDGKRLKEYMESFQDDRIYYASELGIGTNTCSKCEGRSYIEDESAYGTFHIGFGRNIALGGEYEASGHFDIVLHEPSIYADNRLIMEKGSIVVPEPEVW
jgi:leucyl aminopeptidase (aminopeptidase T)